MFCLLKLKEAQCHINVGLLLDLQPVAVLDTFYWGGQAAPVFNQRGTLKTYTKYI